MRKKSKIFQPCKNTKRVIINHFPIEGAMEIYTEVNDTIFKASEYTEFAYMVSNRLRITEDENKLLKLKEGQTIIQLIRQQHKHRMDHFRLYGGY